MSRELLALGGWLAAQGVTHVGMESIGVFWKPPWKRHSKVGARPNIAVSSRRWWRTSTFWKSRSRRWTR